MESPTYLIHFRNCQLYINSTTYTSRLKTLPGNPTQIHLNGVEIKKHQEILNLSLEHLHKLHTETRKELDVIRLSTKSIQWPTWSILSGAFSLHCVIIGIVILLMCFSNRTATVEIQQMSNSTSTREPLRDIQPNFRWLTIQEVIRTEPHL